MYLGANPISFRAIASVGAQELYLPPYSPDLNPIEMVFSKLKTLVRKWKLRKVSELWHKLGELCDVFAPQECLHYLQHAGYKNKFQNKRKYALERTRSRQYVRLCMIYKPRITHSPLAQPRPSVRFQCHVRDKSAQYKVPVP